MLHRNLVRFWHTCILWLNLILLSLLRSLLSFFKPGIESKKIWSIIYRDMCKLGRRNISTEEPLLLMNFSSNPLFTKFRSAKKKLVKSAFYCDSDPFLEHPMGGTSSETMRLDFD